MDYIFIIIISILLLTCLFLWRKLVTQKRKTVNSEEKFQTLIDEFSFGIWITDQETNKTVFINEAASKNFKDFIKTHFFSSIFKLAEKANRFPNKQNSDIQYFDVGQFFIFNRNNRWYEYHKSAIKYNDKPSFVHVINDITSYKAPEVKIQDDSKIIFDNLPVGVVVMNKDDYVEEINSTALSILGIKNKDDAKGTILHERIVFNKIKETNSAFGTYYPKYSVRNEQGKQLYLYRYMFSIEFQNRTKNIEIYVDVSDLEHARKKQVEANKAKSRFLANMSHEIRTPMNGVVGMVDVLLESGINEKQREYATLIKKSSDLLLSIINDILDLSKIEAGKMTIEEIPFRLRDEMKYTIEAFKFKAKEKNLKLEMNINDTVPDKLIGDPFRLRQVITNLVGNAIKFTVEGKILITVEYIREIFDTHIVLFTIEDTGIGIPKDKLSKIFSSFSQAEESTTRKYGGTGLGTTISKQLVELMEGELWVESPSTISTEPKYPGAKFSFTIEFQNDEKLEKDIDYEGITKLTHLKVLIINEQNKKTNKLKASLEKLGIAVDLAHSSRDAMYITKKQFIKSKRHRIIFIEDTPGFDGIKIVQTLYEFDFSERYIIVVISSNDKIGNYAKCRRMNADYYIVKPYEPNEILSIIRDNFPNINIKPDETIEKEMLNTSLSILVAEDDALNQKVAQTIFKSIGFEIDIVDNGNKAIDKVADKHYDLVFMDFIMPVKDGLQAASELRNSGYKTPIIAMTGKATEEDRKKAIEAGMNDFISKPVAITTIKNVLMKWGTTINTTP